MQDFRKQLKQFRSILFLVTCFLYRLTAINSFMITLTSVTKLYGSVIGVNDIDVTLEPGSYGLLGPNGSGKSTLLNLLTGQLRPTLGRVRVYGMQPWNNSKLLMRIGFCPSSDILIEGVSARQWVRTLVRMHGYFPAEAHRRADIALERVGLSSDMDRPMQTYSKGMRQRAKLAQAIAHDPEMLVLDEPFNGLDPVARHDMALVVGEWGRRKSLLVASHMLHELQTICESFLLITGGRLLAWGKAADIEQLLCDVPVEVSISCNRPTRLAELIVATGQVHSVRIEESTVVVGTLYPSLLADFMPRWCVEESIVIDQVRAPDQSLEGLFRLLVQQHRGEKY